MFSITAKKDLPTDHRQLRRNINDWVKKNFEMRFPVTLINSAVIDSMEVECNEPGCAPLEVLVIIGFPEFAVDGYKAVPNKWAGKILKPIIEVTKEDVENLYIPVKCLNNLIVDVDAVMSITVERIRQLPDLDRANALKDLKDMIDEHLKVVDANPEDGVKDIPAEKDIVSIDTITVVPMSSSVTKSDNVDNNKPAVSATTIKGNSYSSRSTVAKASDYVVATNESSRNRHEKGTRPRGCPCCDPDNLDNLIDKMLCMEMPPI